MVVLRAGGGQAHGALLAGRRHAGGWPGGAAVPCRGRKRAVLGVVQHLAGVGLQARVRVRRRVLQAEHVRGQRQAGVAVRQRQVAQVRLQAGQAAGPVLLQGQVAGQGHVGRRDAGVEGHGVRGGGGGGGGHAVVRRQAQGLRLRLRPSALRALHARVSKRPRPRAATRHGRAAARRRAARHAAARGDVAGHPRPAGDRLRGVVLALLGAARLALRGRLRLHHVAVAADALQARQGLEGLLRGLGLQVGERGWKAGER